MKKIRMGLRMHVFLAFLVVFLISFAVIIVSFNVFVQNYINRDATEKLNQSIQLARNLAKEKNKFYSFSMKDNEVEIIINTIVRTLAGSSDVNVALVSSEYKILYPTSSDFLREKNISQDVLGEIRSSEEYLGNTSVRVLEIEKSSYYVSSVPIIINQIGEEQPQDEMYLLLYLDASPYFLFLKSINQILFVILFVTLLLALFASLIVSNSIIRSIRKLTEFAKRIGSGLFKRQEFNLFDKELDVLASDMNGMADKLDQTDKEQKTFFQNASHELRTPLMSIQGYAEGIRYKVFEDEESAADVIISESQRLTGMVENLLSISRMDTAAAGRLQIPKHIMNLNELIDSVVDKVRGSALLANKNISVIFQSQEIYVLGNENDLFRAFENILSNGIRYADSIVSLTVAKKSPDLVDIEFSDNGNGIPAELMPHLFDRFTRGEDGKHGIGLALVKSIVTDHAGYVSAANRTDGNKGAVFTVTLHTTDP